MLKFENYTTSFSPLLLIKFFTSHTLIKGRTMQKWECGLKAVLKYFVADNKSWNAVSRSVAQKNKCCCWFVCSTDLKAIPSLCVLFRHITDFPRCFEN